MFTSLTLQTRSDTQPAIDLTAAAPVVLTPAAPAVLQAVLTDASNIATTPTRRGGTLVTHINGRRLPDTTNHPYHLTIPAMPPGRHKLVLEQFIHGKAIDRRAIFITVAAGEPIPTPTPVEAPKPTFARGVCLHREDADSDGKADALAARLQSLGITTVRWFGATITANGELNSSALRSAHRMTARGLAVTELYGPPERKDGRTPYYPDSDDAVRRFFDTLAALRPATPLHRVSLLNEFNLSQYWRWGRGDILAVEAVAKAIDWVRLARAALGKSVTLIGPSVGWDAGAQPHVAHQRALVDAGLLDHVDAIDAHLYPKSLDFVDAVLGGLRQLCPTTPLHVTEISWRGKTDTAARIASVVPRLDAHRVAEACIYRWTPNPRFNDLSHATLLDEVGVLRGDIAKAWGLTV